MPGQEVAHQVLRAETDGDADDPGRGEDRGQATPNSASTMTAATDQDDRRADRAQHRADRAGPLRAPRGATAAPSTSGAAGTLGRRAGTPGRWRRPRRRRWIARCSRYRASDARAGRSAMHCRRRGHDRVGGAGQEVVVGPLVEAGAPAAGVVGAGGLGGQDCSGQRRRAGNGWSLELQPGVRGQEGQLVDGQRDGAGDRRGRRGPTSVSRRIRIGRVSGSPVVACCSAAHILRACSGSTRVSESNTVNSTAGYSVPGATWW